MRSDDQPPRSATGNMNSKQIKFWDSSSTPVEVYWLDTFAKVPTRATQKNAAVVRDAASLRFSGR